MKILEQVHESWHPLMYMLHKEPLKTLNEKILPEISFQPAKENIFSVFKMPLENIKVVLLGQDPYPTPGVAIGRAFAVSEKTKIPVSLDNIRKEIYLSKSHYLRDEFKESPTYIVPSVYMGNYPDEKDKMTINLFKEWKTLQNWVDQGVFLLNSALTVETNNAGSHLKYWQEFTKKVVSYIASNNPSIWLLWGKKAESFIPYINYNPFNVKGYTIENIEDIPINNDWNYIISTPHPAAESYTNGKAGFFGSNCFYYTNVILKQKGKYNKIKW